MTLYAARSATAIAVLSSFCLVSAEAEGGELRGSVLGVTHSPKSYVRIEISGPENKTTFTDNNGMFVVTLKGGRYTIRVIETPKRMEFSLDVPQAGTTPQTFLLGW